MQSRDCTREMPCEDLVLRSPPNWRVFGLFLLLGCVHLWIAISSLAIGRWASYLSLPIGTVLVTCAVVAFRFRQELTFLGGRKRIRIRNGLRRYYFERFIPFSEVRGVRLTIETGAKARDILIEVLCEGEDVQCPPSLIPRQEALYLAIMMDVPLIKVSEEESEPVENDRFEKEPSRLA